jgi:polysaccharide pyruvyl transferase WcaK-like protein
MLKALLLNDTRPGNHAGCMLVIEQLSRACAAHGIAIVQSFQASPKKLRHFEASLPDIDLVLVNGEGTMHHDSSGCLLLCNAIDLACAANKPVFLINSVWEGNHRANRILTKLSGIYARESLSQKAILDAGYAADAVPDLVFYSDPSTLFAGNAGRKDSVVVFDDVCANLSLALGKFASRHRYPFLRMQPRPSLRSMSSMATWYKPFVLGRLHPQFRISQAASIRAAQLVVTGRFHGVCLAILAGKPFLAVSSNTHKIEGLLKDADLGEAGVCLGRDMLGADPVEGLERKAAEMLEQSSCTDFLADHQRRCALYRAGAKSRIDSMFQEICAFMAPRRSRIRQLVSMSMT